MIAGALILGFFFMIIQNQRTSSDQKLSADVSIKLDSILTSAQQSAGTTFDIEVPRASFLFDACAEQGKGTLTVGGVSLIKTRAMFAPTVIKSVRNKMLLHTQAWSLPFKATNFLYLTSPDIRYIFIQNGIANRFVTGMNPIMPNGSNAEIFGNCGDQYLDKNNYNVRFIIFDSNLDDVSECLTEGSFSSMADEDVTAVVFKKTDDTAITSLADLESYGTVEFWQRGQVNADLTTSSFAGMPSVLGAIITDTYTNYECSMKQAFAQLNVVAEVYQGKHAAIDLIGANELSTQCISDYDSATLEDALTRLVTDASSLSDDIAEQQISNLFTYKSILENHNHLFQLHSCPLLY